MFTFVFREILFYFLTQNFVFCEIFALKKFSTGTVSVVEPVLFGRSRSRCKGPAPAPAPGSGSTLDKTEEILNDILLVCSNID